MLIISSLSLEVVLIYLAFSLLVMLLVFVMVQDEPVKQFLKLLLIMRHVLAKKLIRLIVICYATVMLLNLSYPLWNQALVFLNVLFLLFVLVSGTPCPYN